MQINKSFSIAQQENDAVGYKAVERQARPPFVYQTGALLHSYGAELEGSGLNDRFC